MRHADYRSLSSGQGKALAVAELPEPALRRLLAAPEKLLWQHFDRPVKIDHGALMVEAELPLDTGPVHVALKQYRPRSWWKWVCSWVRPSGARRDWHLGRAVLAAGVPTARPLALLEPRPAGRLHAAYLATEWIESAENLHLFGWRLAEQPLKERLRIAARSAESLGRLVGRMHARKISHRDLKGANLLVVEHDGSTATYLIDLSGVRFRPWLSRRRRAADLARLAAGLEAHPWLSRTVCARFLRAYLREFPAGDLHFKRLWREVERRARRIVRCKRRRGEEVL
jgi:tRNA A-37 threonylcarbamoyl transferase component Bud32